MVIAIYRGIRLDRDKLNKFVHVHNVSGISYTYINKGAHEGLTQILHPLGMDKESPMRIILPPCVAIKGNSYAFVCYDRNNMFSSKEIDVTLPNALPTGFLKKLDPDAPFRT